MVLKEQKRRSKKELHNERGGKNYDQCFFGKKFCNLENLLFENIQKP
jgi:hypothetical protein